MYNPAHPGEVLREYLPEDVSIGEAAKRLGVTRQALSALLNGRAGVGASMALRLEGALGTSAEMWLNMQTNHDLWHARKRPPRVQRGRHYGSLENWKSGNLAVQGRQASRSPDCLSQAARGMRGIF